MIANTETLAVFKLAIGREIRLRRHEDGRLDLRLFEHLGTSAGVFIGTRDGLTIPAEAAADIAAALKDA